MGAERAVDAYGKGLDVRDGIPKGLCRLPRECTARGIGDRYRDHHRQPLAGVFKHLFDGKQRRLEVQCVKGCFRQQNVHTALDEALDLFAINSDQLVKRHRAIAGIIHIRRNRRRAIGRANRASHVTRERRFLRHGRRHRFAGHLRGSHVQLAGNLLQSVIGHANARGAEGVGLNDVAARLKEIRMDRTHQLWLRQTQQVVVPLQILGMIDKAFPTKISLLQRVPLHHRAQRAIQKQNALSQPLAQFINERRIFHT